MDEAQVEKFKLSEGQIEFGKQLQQLARVEKMIKDGLRIKLGELEQLQELYGQAMGKKKELLQMAPTKDTKELPGQDEGR